MRGVREVQGGSISERRGAIWLVPGKRTEAAKGLGFLGETALLLRGRENHEKALKTGAGPSRANIPEAVVEGDV